MKPHDGDNLGWVRVTNGNDNILLVSRGGKVIQFSENDVRVMGRAAAGVRGMRIGEDDSVVEADVVDAEAKYVFSVTETGKRCDIYTTFGPYAGGKNSRRMGNAKMDAIRLKKITQANKYSYRTAILAISFASTTWWT